jgi:hypothetical protein
MISWGMKMKIFFLLLITLPSLTWAAERNIYDIMYLPNQGVNFGKSTFSYLDASARGKTSGLNFTSDTKGYLIDQVIGRSVSDKLSLSLGFGYSNLKATTKGDSPIEDSTQTTKGLSDPTISGRYRILENDLILDLTGNLIVSTGDSESDGDESNNKNGGHELKVGAQIGSKLDNLQWAANFAVTHYFKSTTDTDGTKVKDDEHNSYVFDFGILKPISNSSFLKGLASVEFFDEYKSNDDSKTSGQTTTSVGASYLHMISSNLLFEGGIKYGEINFAGFDKYRFYILDAAFTYQF